MGRKWIAKGEWVINGLNMDGKDSKRAVRGEGN